MPMVSVIYGKKAGKGKPTQSLQTLVAGALLAASGLADDNDDLIAGLQALLLVHHAALPLSFSPDPLIGIPASAVTFGTNPGLKDTRAMFRCSGVNSHAPGQCR
jgi:hypothetical protein